MDNKIMEFLDSKGIVRGAGTMQSSGNYITIFELMQQFLALSQHAVSGRSEQLSDSLKDQIKRGELDPYSPHAKWIKP